MATGNNVVAWDLARRSHRIVYQGTPGALLADAGGNLWIGTWTEGLLRLDRGGTLRKAHDDSRVWSLAADLQGNIWATIASGVVQLDSEGTVLRQALRSNRYRPVWDLAVGRSGEVWVVTGSATGRLVRLDPDGSETEVWNGPGSALAVAVDVDDSVWLGRSGAGIEHRTRDGSLLGSYRSTSEGLTGDKILRITVAEDGTKWIGTDQGLSRLNVDGTWRRHTTDDGLHGRQVRAIALGSDGDVWIGTSGGLAQLKAEPPPRAPDASGLVDWPTEPGPLSRRRANGIATDSSGNLWFGMVAGGLARLGTDGQWTQFTVESTNGGLVGNDVREVLSHPDGSLWIATSAGICRRDLSGEWRAYTTTEGLASNSARALAVDPQGRVWVGTDKGYSIVDVDGQVIDQNRGSLYMWYRDGTVGIDVGASVDAQAIRHRYTLPSRLSADNVVGLATMTTNRVLAWYDDGTSSGGSTANVADVDDLDDHHRLPPGRTGDDIVAIGGDGGDVVRVYYRDGTVSGGSRSNFTNVAPAPYALPSGKQPDDLIDVAFASGDRVHAWYRDGTMSVGDPFDLGKYAAPQPYPFPLGRRAEDVIGIAFVRPGLVNNLAVDGHGNAWLGRRDDSDGADDKLFRLTPDGIATAYDTQNGLAKFGSDWVQVGRIVAAPDGNVYVSNFTTAIFSPEGTLVGRIDGILGDELKEVRDFIWDSDGTLWIGTTLYLAHRRNDGTWERWPDRWPNHGNIPGGYSVQRLASDAAGNIWATTEDGVFRFRRKGVGDHCANAFPIDKSEVAGASIESEDDVDIYRFDVDQVHSTVEITITDPEHRLDVWRTCDEAGGSSIGASSGSGRHIAPSEFGGFAHRHQFKLGSQTGPQYVAIRPRPGMYEGKPIDYDVRVSVAAPNQPLTLILTHTTRLRVNYPDSDWQRWEAALQALARHPTVRGRVITDLLNDKVVDPQVVQAYRRWQNRREDDALEAAALANAVRDGLVRLKQEEMPYLSHVVIAGDDNILPFARVASEAPAGAGHGWVRESSYMADPAPLSDSSRIGSALLLDYALTDDVYAMSTRVTWGEVVEGPRGREQSTLDLPQLAVGRLVETPADMVRTIETFLARDGVLALGETLAAGYDFMADGTELGDAYLGRYGGVAEERRRRLIGDEHRQAAWHEAILKNPFDLLFFAAHATHYFHETPGNGRLRAQDILAAEADYAGRLVYGLACHAGLNVPGNGSEHAKPVDFPEAWSRRGATYIGTTGWAYGFEGAVQYQEDLMAEFTRRLVSGRGMSVGEGLTRAKRSYYWDMGELNHFHAKTIAGTVLYGLPMYRVATAEAAPDFREGDWLTWSGGDVLERLAPDLAVKRQSLRVKDGSWAKGYTAGGEYYELAGRRPRPEAGQPAQPRLRWPRFTETVPVEFVQQALEPRGAVWLGGAYVDYPGFRPWVIGAGSMGRLAQTTRAEAFSAPGWFPSVPVRLRTLPPEASKWREGNEAQVVLTLGQFDSATLTERLYDSAEVAVYYSASADVTAPAVDAVETRTIGAQLEVAVQAHDESTVLGVYATWTDGGGVWRSEWVAAPGGDGWWRATMPREAIALVQVVDRAGNVAVADYGGAFYRLAGW